MKLISSLIVMLMAVSSVFAYGVSNNKYSKINKVQEDKLKESLFTEKDDHRVKLYFKGDYLYSAIPYKDWYVSPDRAAILDKVVKKLTPKFVTSYIQKVAKELNLKSPEINKFVNSIDAMNFEEIKTQMEQLNLNRLDVWETIDLASDLEESNKYTKMQILNTKKLENLISEFEENIKPMIENTNENFFADYGVPSAMYVVLPSIKFKSGLLANASQYGAVGNVAKAIVNFLATGTWTATYFVHPWKVRKINLNTLEVSDDITLISDWKLWVSGSPNRKQADPTNTVSRVGLGLIWGDFNELSEITGMYTGGSTSLTNQSNTIPTSLNIKYGGIGPAYNQLGDFFKGNEIIKNVYVQMSLQKGWVSAVGKKPVTNFDLGYMGNLGNIAENIKISYTDMPKEMKKDLNINSSVSSSRVTNTNRSNDNNNKKDNSDSSKKGDVIDLDDFFNNPNKPK